MTKQVSGNNQKYRHLKHLLKEKAGLKAESEQMFAIEKLISFVVLLDEIEQENIKLKQQGNGNK
jgi:hypothetical protein